MKFQLIPNPTTYLAGYDPDFESELLYFCRWREKVFALLVQLKSADIVHSKDELNWEEKVTLK